MTLVCDGCRSYDFRIIAQSYDGDHAYEVYECGCGRTGSLTNHPTLGTMLDGCVTSDGR